MKALGVSIGGVSVAMVSREKDLDLALHGPRERFAAGTEKPDITVEAVWECEEAPTRVHRAETAEKLFDSGGVWQLYREDGRLAFHLRSPKFGSVPYTKATFSPDFTTGTVYLRRECVNPSVPLYPLEYPLDELLITNWLALGRGVEIHACGVVDGNGDGYLFAGYSGAGKTTTARLWCREHGAGVLSDDRIILRKIDDEVWMYGTPWHGDEPLASPKRAVLKRGFFLRHADHNQFTPVTGAQAVMELFARSFPPFFNPRAVGFTLSSMSEITKAVPFGDLGFVPDLKLPDFVRSS